MHLAASDTTDLVLLAEEPVQFCPLVRSAPQASLRGGYSVDWATGVITVKVSVGFSGILKCYDLWKVEK